VPRSEWETSKYEADETPAALFKVPEELTVTQIVNIFSAFHEIWNFITEFTRHIPEVLSWAGWIQSTSRTILLCDSFWCSRNMHGRISKVTSSLSILRLNILCISHFFHVYSFILTCFIQLIPFVLFWLLTNFISFRTRNEMIWHVYPIILFF
jgi:hypothetical protein